MGEKVRGRGEKWKLSLIFGDKSYILFLDRHPDQLADGGVKRLQHEKAAPFLGQGLIDVFHASFLARKVQTGTEFFYIFGGKREGKMRGEENVKVNSPKAFQRFHTDGKGKALPEKNTILRGESIAGKEHFFLGTVKTDGAGGVTGQREHF